VGAHPVLGYLHGKMHEHPRKFPLELGDESLLVIKYLRRGSVAYKRNLFVPGGKLVNRSR
jgi:hypothetical protein